MTHRNQKHTSKGILGMRFSLVQLTHYIAIITSFPFDDRLLPCTPHHKASLGSPRETQVTWSSDVPWLGFQSLPKHSKKSEAVSQMESSSDLWFMALTPHVKCILIWAFHFSPHLIIIYVCSCIKTHYMQLPYCASWQNLKACSDIWQVKFLQLLFLILHFFFVL